MNGISYKKYETNSSISHLRVGNDELDFKIYNQCYLTGSRKFKEEEDFNAGVNYVYVINLEDFRPPFDYHGKITCNNFKIYKNDETNEVAVSLNGTYKLFYGDMFVFVKADKD